MSIAVIFLLAVGLSMDAFAVSVTNGICLGKVRAGQALACGICFGLFQGLMPLVGYLLGRTFADRVAAFDHWIALIVLGFIGVKMIADTVSDNDEVDTDYRLTPTLLIAQGIATSIDALAVGVSFAALSVNIAGAVLLICAVTFALSCAGAAAGGLLGGRSREKARIIGGIILICIGFRLFVQ